MKFDFMSKSLSSLADIQTGPFGSQLHKEDYVDIGTPIVTVEHLGRKRFSEQNLPCVSAQDKERLSKYILQEGDIVFSRVGSVDRCSYVSKEYAGWMFSGRCLRVRPNADIDSQFLYYYFTLETTKQFVRGIATGATMPSINTKFMGEVPVVYPSIEIQRKIAGILSAIDNKIDVNNAINENLLQQLLSIYDKLIATQEIRKSVELKALCAFQEGYVNPPQAHPEYFNGSVKWLRAVDINESFIIETSRTLTTNGFESAKKSALLFQPNTIAISKSGTIGRLGIVADFMCGNRAVINVRPLDQTQLPLIYAFLKSKQREFPNLAVGSVQKNLYVSLLEPLLVDLPEAGLVNQFCDIGNSLLERMQTNCKENLALTKLRDTLLPKLMSGELDVSNLDL